MRSLLALAVALSLLSTSAIAQSDTAAAEFSSASLASPTPGEEPVRRVQHYHLSWKVDAPIIGVGMAWSGFAFTTIYGKPDSDSGTIARLSKDNLPFFDRWAVRHSDKADEISNYPFYASIPYPFLLLADRAIRKDAAKVGALYLEAFAITGFLYTGCDYFVDRYRPETYDVTKPFGERLTGNEKNAFFAGHPALVSTATFFAASVYDEYHPHSAMKWVLYGVAAGATGATVVLRHIAGKHFPSDLLIGTAIGTASGMLVPRLHRYKQGKKHALIVSPAFGEGMGMAATWRF